MNIEVIKIDKEKRDQCIEMIFAKMNGGNTDLASVTAEQLLSNPAKPEKQTKGNPIIFEEAQLI